jgi:1,4-alpha-glucan branching enzyme
LFCAYQCAHPGKKLLFMGSEFGQWTEWRDHDDVDWRLLNDPLHEALRDCVRNLNHLYLGSPQLHGSDCDHEGFRGIDMDNANDSVWAFQRSATGDDPGAPIICVFNATPVPRDGYAIGVTQRGTYRKLFDSDDPRFGGSGYSRQSDVTTSDGAWHGGPFTLHIDLPPLGAVFFLGPL